MTVEANDLMLFARVVEHGSFSRAAEKVGLPKSTVSRRIAALEAELGERLLQRTTRRLVLTDFGTSLLEHARRLADEVDAAGALAQHRQSEPTGRLRMSMPADFAHLTMAPIIAAYLARYPEVTVELDLSPRRVDVLGEDFDLVFRMTVQQLPDDSTLVARRIMTTANHLYAAPAYLKRRGVPLHPDELAGHDLLALRRQNGGAIPWQLTHGKQTWERAMKARLVANSPDLLLRFARQGSGICALGAVQAEPYLKSGELVRVLPDWNLPEGSGWAVYPGRKLMPARTRAFLDVMCEWLGDEERRQSVRVPGKPSRTVRAA